MSFKSPRIVLPQQLPAPLIPIKDARLIINLTVKFFWQCWQWAAC
jgi:hypothetical protein